MKGWITQEMLEAEGFKTLEEAEAAFEKKLAEVTYETIVGDVVMMYRRPLLPVLIIGKHGLKASYEYPQLAVSLVATEKTGYWNLITVIDAKGYEFHFEMERNVLRPDWFDKRWRKKEILALYNNHCIIQSNQYQPRKSLASLSVNQLMLDICGLLNMN